MKFLTCRYSSVRFYLCRNSFRNIFKP